jgi:DNA polymerase I-like protein with 3'-5' exonuclease and polymerase domains
VVDTHPDEIDMVSGLVTEAMTGAVGEAEHLWGYKLVVPLEVEVSTGKSWADCK